MARILLPDHILQEAGAPEQSIGEYKRGISPSERLHRTLQRMNREDLQEIAGKVREGKMNASNVIGALVKKEGCETLIARLRVGEFA